MIKLLSKNPNDLARLSNETFQVIFKHTAAIDSYSKLLSNLPSMEATYIIGSVLVDIARKKDKPVKSFRDSTGGPKLNCHSP